MLNNIYDSSGNWDIASKICNGDIDILKAKGVVKGGYGDRFYDILDSMAMQLDNTEVYLTGRILSKLWESGLKGKDIKVLNIASSLAILDELIHKVEVNNTQVLSGDNKQGNQVNHPTHYNTGKIECIDAITDIVKGCDSAEGFMLGNTVKYLWRWKHKNGLEDLYKARWYLSRELEYIVDLGNKEQVV